MKLDLTKTQHYTSKSPYICKNLIKYIPNDAKLIEPFAGNGDLLKLFPDSDWECYDLDSNLDFVEKRDTLMNPPNYSGKWVITNPPYLARNKSTDKTIFNTYDVDDLYKASIETIMSCDGGILIIPTNFFTDERSSNLRDKFLSNFKILKLNIFTEPVFETTTYSICSFAFVKSGDSICKQTIPTLIMPEGTNISIELDCAFGFRIAGDIYSKVENTNSIFKRLMLGGNNEGYITDIKLYAIDSRYEKIRLEIDTDHFYGKSTDRTYATLVSSIPLTKEEQLNIVDKFNSTIKMYRESYCDLFMTNYRDYNRKRISFDFAYKLATVCNS